MPDDNDHILRTWHEWEIDGRLRRVILVVETDVEMRPEEAEFDGMLLDNVRQAALNRMRTSPSAIDMLKIVPVR